MFDFKTYFLPLFSGIVLLVIHTFALDFFEVETKTFYYNLWQQYLFFVIGSILVIAICIKTKQKNLDQVGMVFMAATVVKMMISFAVAVPIINQTSGIFKLQKFNFFMIFCAFLAVETIVVIRILNRK
jgi:hypothetical protein